MTLSRFDIEEAERVALPCPFSWPVRVANLKRCLLVSRIPVGDSGKSLVLVNAHLEAYDDGSGKEAQTAMLRELIEAEYEKGNYVIVTGDFNQSFSNIDTSAYPLRDPGLWQCGTLDTEAFSDRWQFLMDTSAPTCRSLDRPYDGDRDRFQFYMIDGFIVSDNLTVTSMETMDLDFENSDHNPVLLTVQIPEK
jgi:endonuclease/exonuclease/phosphatase family metal-dependent hydrolase